MLHEVGFLLRFVGAIDWRMGVEAETRIRDWQALGVRTVTGAALPKADRMASLLRAGKKTYLVYPNYDTLLGYNCAHAYALAVGLLADRIGAS